MIDKSAWGQGPWQDEPDALDWRDERTGFACAMRRHPMNGTWCGHGKIGGQTP
jgi:hypothetical protein